MFDENWPKFNQVINESGSSILTKVKEIWKVARKLSREKCLRPAVAVAYEPVQIVIPVYGGDFIILLLEQSYVLIKKFKGTILFAAIKLSRKEQFSSLAVS